MSISWENTKYIFDNDGYRIISSDKHIPCYVDREIDGKVSPNFLLEPCRALQAFSPDQQGSFEKKIKTNMGKSMAECRWWQDRVYRLELWTDKYGYGVVFGPLQGSCASSFVCCNYSGHPSVETKDFSFCNSDGSTFVDVNYVSQLHISWLTDFVLREMECHIFEQIH